MNTQPKSKVLVIIIGILLIANIITLTLFLMNKNEPGRSGRGDRRTQITNFLKKDVGFTESQLNNYDTLSKEHRAAIKDIFDDIAADRENVFKQVASQQFSDSAIDIAANAIAGQQKIFEIKMLHHLKDIRNICTPAQQAVFDTGFYKIIAKRGEGRKDKERKQ